MKPTKKFIYIVAYTLPPDRETICFSRFIVVAEDEDDAYYIGMETCDDEVMKEKGAKLRNNYVIPVDAVAAKCRELDEAVGRF